MLVAYQAGVKPRLGWTLWQVTATQRLKTTGLLTSRVGLPVLWPSLPVGLSLPPTSLVGRAFSRSFSEMMAPLSRALAPAWRGWPFL